MARQVGREHQERWEIDLPTSESEPEAVLRALANGLTRLRERSANAVTVVVTDRTLAGYVWRGWERGSLRMHFAFERLIEVADGMKVRFEPRTRPR